MTSINDNIMEFTGLLVDGRVGLLGYYRTYSECSLIE